MGYVTLNSNLSQTNNDQQYHVDNRPEVDSFEIVVNLVGVLTKMFLFEK